MTRNKANILKNGHLCPNATQPTNTKTLHATYIYGTQYTAADVLQCNTALTLLRIAYFNAAQPTNTQALHATSGSQYTATRRTYHTAANFSSSSSMRIPSRSTRSSCVTFYTKTRRTDRRDVSSQYEYCAESTGPHKRSSVGG